MHSSLARIASPRDGSFNSMDFQHTPLDRSHASIRFVQILPDLSDGVVECGMQHSVLPALEHRDRRLQSKGKSSHVLLSFIYVR
jgi:hypothetical protein